MCITWCVGIIFHGVGGSVDPLPISRGNCLGAVESCELLANKKQAEGITYRYEQKDALKELDCLVGRDLTRWFECLGFEAQYSNHACVFLKIDYTTCTCSSVPKLSYVPLHCAIPVFPIRHCSQCKGICLPHQTLLASAKESEPGSPYCLVSELCLMGACHDL